MVTCFAWIAHNAGVFQEPNQYASAAFCRVKMACTWKCMLHLPISWAISQTRCMKGSLQIRRLVLFWSWQISWRASDPGWYLWGFFTFPAFRNFFWRVFPPTVSWSFLLASFSPPNIDGLAFTAIWTNCWVGDDSGNLPTSSNFSVSTFLLSTSPGVGGASTSGTGGSAGTGGSTGPACTSACVFTFWVFPSSPFLGVIFVHAILELEENHPIRSQSSHVKVMWYLL